MRLWLRDQDRWGLVASSETWVLSAYSPMGCIDTGFAEPRMQVRVELRLKMHRKM